MPWKPDITIYTGHRYPEPGKSPSTLSASVVLVDNRELSPVPSLRLRNHSPDGFNWGYPGSGPAQLALALLLDYTGDEQLAERWYQEFKRAYVMTQDEDASWKIYGHEIRDWLNMKQAKAEQEAL
jgi:hypothetical protein